MGGGDARDRQIDHSSTRTLLRPSTADSATTSLIGGAASDVFHTFTSTTTDIMDGSGGADRVSYANRPERVVVTARRIRRRRRRPARATTITDVESLDGGHGDDELRASPAVGGVLLRLRRRRHDHRLERDLDQIDGGTRRRHDRRTVPAATASTAATGRDDIDGQAAVTMRSTAGRQRCAHRRPGRDDLTGGDGGDTLDGGAGIDSFDGGAGPDSVRSRDGVAETVGRCGADVDGAIVDPVARLAGASRPTTAPRSRSEGRPGDGGHGRRTGRPAAFRPSPYGRVLSPRAVAPLPPDLSSSDHVHTRPRRPKGKKTRRASRHLQAHRARRLPGPPRCASCQRARPIARGPWHHPRAPRIGRDVATATSVVSPRAARP